MTPRVLRAAAVTATALCTHTVVNAALLRRAPIDGPGPRRRDRRRVSVLIPARDEAARIADCIHAVLASRWDDLEVLVLDDRSVDGTADAVRAAADGDPRVKVLAGARLPHGWLGKPWACAQLADAATGEVLVFVDADVVVAPHAVAATVALLDRGLDLACPYPRQLADGPLARLVQPLLQWSWLTFLPLRVAERPWFRSMTAANGQLLACTARTYAAAGGHGAVRADVLEDLALARAVKRVGLRAGVTDGTTLATCRMYDSAGELTAGYTKSLWAAFGSGGAAVAVGAMLAWLYVLPSVALIVALRRGDATTARTAGLGYAAGVAGRMVAAHRTGGRPLDGVAHPLSVTALLALTAASLAGRRRGTLRWRGRPVVVDAADRPARHTDGRGTPAGAAG